VFTASSWRSFFQFPDDGIGADAQDPDLSELVPKIDATAVDRGFGSFVTTIFCVKE
jgi:hypothetical protein